MLTELRNAAKQASDSKNSREQEIARLHKLTGDVLKEYGQRRPNMFFWMGLPILPVDLALISTIGWFITENNPIDLHTKRVYKGLIPEDEMPITVSSKYGNVEKSPIKVNIRSGAYELELYSGFPEPFANITVQTPENPKERSFFGTSMVIRPAGIGELMAFHPMLEHILAVEHGRKTFQSQ